MVHIYVPKLMTKKWKHDRGGNLWQSHTWEILIQLRIKQRQCSEISNLKNDGLIHCQPSHNKACLSGGFFWISFALNTMTHQ